MKMKNHLSTMEQKNNKTSLKMLPKLWMIAESDLALIEARYMQYLQNNEMFFGFFESKEVDLSTIIGNVQIIDISGHIVPKSDEFSFLFDEIGLDRLSEELKGALANDAVETIVLKIDSGGGIAFGVPEFANQVFEANEIKPVIAITSTCACSAAYYIAAAASQVFITSEAVITGSIGVVTTHVDISGFHDFIGVKVTEVVAGDEKRITSSLAPLSAEGKKDLERSLFQVYDAFVSDVARFRGVSNAVVLSEMANGRTFTGSQAIKAGLVDAKIDFDNLISNLNNNNGGVAMAGNEKLTLEDLKEKHSELYEVVVQIGHVKATEETNAKQKVDIENAKTASFEAGVQAENKRIFAIDECSSPGLEALIAEAKADTTMTEEKLAVKIVKQMKTAKVDLYAKIKDEAIKPIGPSSDIVGDQTSGASKVEFKTLVDDYVKEHECSRADAIMACAKSNPEEHKKFIDAK